VAASLTLTGKRKRKRKRTRHHNHHAIAVLSTARRASYLEVILKEKPVWKRVFICILILKAGFNLTHNLLPQGTLNSKNHDGTASFIPRGDFERKAGLKTCFYMRFCVKKPVSEPPRARRSDPSSLAYHVPPQNRCWDVRRARIIYAKNTWQAMVGARSNWRPQNRVLRVLKISGMAFFSIIRKIFMNFMIPYDCDWWLVSGFSS